jgi:hypothetical protein
VTIELTDFQSRLRAFLGLQGAVLTDQELSQMVNCYPRCPGREHWDVRQYVRPAGPGAREYRVVRGSSVQDVYCSADRGRAVAVGTALNELESQERSGDAPEASAQSRTPRHS